ncbi:hypothetical protein IWW50_001925 [Coemansia erecta]|nr:hypothetical protein GGF43_001675 [Coemansia sp. RSA 2618]KAJ2827365.1 hypothetical protein IWW50_001925 [Coemansia erecta]
MNAAGPRQMKQLQALYEGQRDAYLKYKDLADKAAKKMHQTVLMMMQAMDESLEQPVCSAEMSPELVSSRNAGTTRIPPSALRMPERYISSDSSELPEARSLLGRDSLGISGPRSAPVASKAVLPPPLADNTVDASNNLGLCVRDAPSRPYQFTTRRLDAFKLKPRAALTCKFEGSDSEVSVAYGMDGTVQLWSPKEKRLLQKLDSSTLGMDFAEHLTQVTPSLLVAVSGERTKLGSLRNPGQLFFLNQAASGSSAYPRLQNAEQLNVLPESDLISVAEGMVGANTHEDSGLLLTGGQRDRKVYIWALDKSEGRVTAVEKRLLVKTRHTSRISALCYEPFHNFVLSGSDSGRVNIGCAETGREITVDNGEKVPPNVVGKLLVCPTNPNLVLASIGATKDQMRIFDIRGKLSIQRPALVLGQQRERTQSRYLRPAWHPHGDLIFYPFLRGSTETSHEGMVAIWDVRFKRCADTAPQVFHPHKEDVWSVNFAESSNANQHTMVTVSTDRSIGFTDFML